MSDEAIVISIIAIIVIIAVSFVMLATNLSAANNMIDCIYSQHTIEICEEILNYSKED